MGMYTELVLKCEVKQKLPEEVEAVLQYLFNGKDLPAILPSDSFFQKPRWAAVGCCCSYYHTPFSLSKYESNYIFSRSDLKNYDGEIEAFLGWLRPYINEPEEKCIGWIWYEEFSSPRLIFKDASRQEAVPYHEELGY